MGVRTSFRQGLLCAAAIITTMAMPADTLALEPAEFTIEAAPLGDALRAFSQQSGRAILFSEGTVSGLTAPRLNGTYEPEAALTLLLQGTGLEFTQGPNGNLIVRRQTGADPVQTPEPGRGRGREVQGEPDPETDSRRIETITVTGTSIRGIAPESSPLFVFDREEIIGSGLVSTEAFLRTLPQMFGGGSSEFVPTFLPNDANTSRNKTAGTSANLRGLGSRGTLVLLNGNRLAPTSEIGDFVDVSMIPLSALDRVDVLTDGASSIYGGDAIAGVVNFVLRDDFQGAETTIRYGTVTRGSLEEFRFGQTLGSSWDTGNALMTYEYFSRDRLSLADRPEIEMFPPRIGGLILPPRDQYFLLPKQSRHSAVLSARQDLSTDAALNLTALYSLRSVESSSFGASGTLNAYESDSENATISVGTDYTLSSRWWAQLNSTYSRIQNESLQQTLQTADGSPLSRFFVETSSDVWSADAKIDGDLLELPGGTVKVAFGGHYRHENFENEILDVEVTASGSRNVQAMFGEALIPLVGERNRIPGVAALSLNISGRGERYSDFGTSFSPKIGALWSPVDGVRLRASYSTSYAPPALGRAFSLNRDALVLPYSFLLALSGSAAPDPRLADADYMQVTGTASNLRAETSQTYTGGFDADFSFGRHSWSANGTYYNIKFEDRLGLTPIPQNQATFLATLIAWDDPSAFPEGSVIFFPTPQQIEDIVSVLYTPVQLFPGSSLDNVGVIDSTLLTRNLAITETDGVDIRVAYDFDADFGRIFAGFNANYILDFNERAASTTPSIQTLNTLYRPVDLQLRGHVGLSTAGWSGTLFANHVASYKSDETPNAVPIDSWTTFDAVVSYEFSSDSPALNGTAITLAVTNTFDTSPPRTPASGGSGLNGYDPTNASPLGRMVSFEIRKRF